jgi:oxygen-independent coproporphyrinogen-3 oxidase
MSEDAEVKRYFQSVITELQLIKKHLHSERKVSQVHFGGGTPNSVALKQIQDIMNTVSDSFDFIDRPEIAIECNPAYLDHAYIDGLAQLGFNRISLGIQDFNPDLLKALNRDPPKLPMEELVGYIRERSEKIAVNFDFIYGLPMQTVESFEKNIHRALKIRPDRLVTFSYAHLPSVFKGQKALEKLGLPEPDEKFDMFSRAFHLLTQGDYRAIGFDHYALESDELSRAQQNKTLHRNFQGYCTRETTGQVYAFGVSGISQLENMYAQTTKSIGDYIQAIENKSFSIEKGYVLSEDEKIVREVITELLCNLYADFRSIGDKLGISPEDVTEKLNIDKDQLDAFCEDLLIRYSGEYIEILPAGLPFTRNIAAGIDPLMQGKQTNKFSRTL